VSWNFCTATKQDGTPCTRPSSGKRADGLCASHGKLADGPPALSQPRSVPTPRWAKTPPEEAYGRKDDPWWQTIPSPLPAAELARLRRAVGYQESAA